MTPPPDLSEAPTAAQVRAYIESRLAGLSREPIREEAR